MTRKKTHLEYENELFEAEVDCFPLEQYNGNKVPLKHICLKGHEWFAAPIYILRGNRCPECVGLKRKTTQNVVKNANILRVKVRKMRKI